MEEHCPHKTVVTTWRTTRNKIPTRDNLRTREIIGANGDISCALCREETESVDHLFMRCRVSAPLWYRCLQWINRPSPIANNIKDQLHALLCGFRDKKGGHLVVGLWIFFIWVMEKERNKVIFENKVFNWESAFMVIKTRLWSWMSVSYPNLGTVSFREWMNNPFECLL